LKETAKSCDNCCFSYWQIETGRSGRGSSIRQHCHSASYNSPEYTQEMILEDWAKGYCRFWEPPSGKGI